MVVGGSQQETLNLDFVLFGTRQQGLPVIVRGLMLRDGFSLMLPSFTAQSEHTEANKQRKKGTRADKQKYMEELATTGGEASREGIMKQQHDTTKKLSGKYSKPDQGQRKQVNH
ncbi:unnamed protein product [Schistosoma margrebowiei]|uniref:Uncharacterized protein n=1 Tax=Schistosoma margrebowiei TaxID=48269 RepID=A0A183LZN2_9TREM|nr:unnamed protein product [Schistosoma margrebowiei]